MWRVPLLLLAACLPCGAREVPLEFRVEPDAAEVWVMREEGYGYLGRARERLFLDVDERDLGRTPAVFRIFVRRPWEGAGPPPARAVSVTLLPTGGPLRWEGTLGWEDRLLASASFRWGVLVGLVAVAGTSAWLLRRLRRKSARGQLLEAAAAVGSALDREQLLAFTRTALQRAVPHQSGLVVEVIGTRATLLAGWGPPVPLEGPLEELCRAVFAERQARRYDDLSRTIYAPPGVKSPCLVAVPMQSGVMVLLGERPFESELVELLAFQIGQALESYRLQQQRRTAAVGQLAAGVAHELNTPLGAILLSVESALSLVERSPDKAGKRLERAATSVQTANRIVSGLLAYSRRTLERKVAFDARQVVEDALERVKSPLIQAELAEVPSLEGDPAGLREAVYQLVQNAVQAEPTVIRVRLESLAQEVRLTVEDDGCGMPSEVLERAFEPFFTTRPVGSGTGLGLAVAWRVAELHGGELTAVSEPGRGSTLTLALPVG